MVRLRLSPTWSWRWARTHRSSPSLALNTGAAAPEPHRAESTTSLGWSRHRSHGPTGSVGVSVRVAWAAKSRFALVVDLRDTSILYAGTRRRSRCAHVPAVPASGRCSGNWVTTAQSLPHRSLLTGR